LALAERTASQATPGPAFDLAMSGRVGILVAAGRLHEVDSLWQAGAFASGGIPAVALAQVVVHTALLGIEDSALTARALQILTEQVPLDSALAYFNSPRPVWSVAFTLGAWHAARGDSTVAKRWLLLVPQFPAGGSPRDWREAIAADIAGRLAERRGDTDSAGASIARAFTLWTVHTENVSGADVEPAMRFRYARLLLDRGMADSAARILRSFVPPTSWVGSYVPLAHLALGDIAERAGDAALAARHYDQALQLWSLGDDSVRLLRTEAEAGVQRTARGPVFRYGK
jgi:hypothetical protein